MLDWVINSPMSSHIHVKLFRNIWARYDNEIWTIQKWRILNEYTKYKKHKNTKKHLLRKTISVFQLALSNLFCWIVGCFQQYFVPVSEAFHVNSVVISTRSSSITSLSGVISVVLLCSCYMLHFWFYVQFDQFAET